MERPNVSEVVLSMAQLRFQSTPQRHAQREKQKSIAKITTGDLQRSIASSQHLLQNKKALASLPDKGARIRERLVVLQKEIDERSTRDLKPASLPDGSAVKTEKTETNLNELPEVQHQADNQITEMSSAMSSLQLSSSKGDGGVPDLALLRTRQLLDRHFAKSGNATLRRAVMDAPSNAVVLPTLALRHAAVCDLNEDLKNKTSPDKHGCMEKKAEPSPIKFLPMDLAMASEARSKEAHRQAVLENSYSHLSAATKSEWTRGFQFFQYREGSNLGSDDDDDLDDDLESDSDTEGDERIMNTIDEEDNEEDEE